MSLVRPGLWVPAGVDSLELVAEQVVRSERNTLVVAGPGAGKTELLAQRACFLLDTGACPAPYRILAISFKRDAAKNLGERVRKRCGDRAQRFDSYTLDAFAKSIVDRFRLALPTDWCPKASYEVMTSGLRVDDMRDWLEGAGLPEGHSPVNFMDLPNERIKKLFDRITHGHVLPFSDVNIDAMERYWGLRWWRKQLDRPEGSENLSFPMLNRLAAFMLRRNPKLNVALHATYGFVFMDELQDTTAAQYDLVRAAFQGTKALITAVGDSKQGIMVWAGAMPRVFGAYMTDFGAERHELVRNYRSAPELVRMQHVIAQIVEAGTPAAAATKVDPAGNCVLLEFSNPEDEATHLAELITRGIHSEGMKARDFCLIVRQRTGTMIESLKAALAVRNVRLRDESQLQDLLAEPVVSFLLSILRLATRARDADAWDNLTRHVALLRSLGEDDTASKIEKECKRLLHHAREALVTGRDITTLPTELLSLIGVATFKSVYRQYGKGSYLNDIVAGISAALGVALGESTNAREAIDILVGIDVVPAMTIHKSKGLEFHTVIFLGLEDSQWWAFATQADEEKRGFFVAFSRAIERVIFTFSDLRDEPWGRRRQQKVKIGDLYSVLQQAGVLTLSYRPQSDVSEN